MLRRITNLFSYTLLFLFTLFFTFYYRQSFFLVLFLLLCILPFFSYMMARYAFQKLDVSLSLKILTGEKNSTLPLYVHLDNKSLFPFSHCEVTLRISSAFYEKDELEVLILPCESRKLCTTSFPITYTKSGCYQIQLIQVKVFDYLHFFSFKKNNDKQVSVKIMPSLIQSFAVPDTLYGEGFDEFEENTLKGNYSSNVTDIREYIPGDRLQKIHWKLSAKLDELMVKENEATSSKRFIILPELYQPKDYTNLSLDMTLDYTYALARQLLSKQETFFLTWYCTKQEAFLPHYIQNTSDLQSALEELYYDMPYEDESLGRTLYEATQLKAGTLLYVTYKGVEYVTL